MARMDGVDFCNHVGRDKNDVIRSLPIIILTGERDTFVHDVTKQLGATMVRVEPVSAGDLKTQIEAAVGFTIRPARKPSQARRAKRNWRPGGAAQSTAL